ncbi:hypothetical protein G6F19_013633 [Rhizopus arrhizus]|nr:hypothetical protein G6F19_013633 [Rhizopus arrhizus]
MTDIPDINEQPKLYTEEQIFELFQRFKAEEQPLNEPEKNESYHWKSLPLWTRLRGNSTLATSNVTKETSNHTVDTTQVVNAYYKGSEINRTHGRAATELYEQLHTIKRGNLPADQAHQLLDEAIESAKRLAIHAWFHARQQDEDAKHYATKALKLPQSLRHLEICRILL